MSVNFYLVPLLADCDTNSVQIVWCFAAGRSPAEAGDRAAKQRPDCYCAGFGGEPLTSKELREIASRLDEESLAIQSTEKRLAGTS